MARRVSIVVVLVAMFFCCGCSRVAKEGLYSFQGASGKFIIIKGSGAQLSGLADGYGKVKIEPFTSDINSVCPRDFFSKLAIELPEKLEYRKEPKKDKPGIRFFQGPGDRTLVIRGTVIHYETADLMGVAMGPMEQAICRVSFIDQSDETVLGEVNCIGRVKSSLRKGPGELAEGVAKGVLGVLKPKKSEDD